MRFIVFGDGTKIECIEVMEGSERFDGTERRCLTVQFAPGAVSFDTLDLLLNSTETLRRIEHVNDAVPYQEVGEDGTVKKDENGNPVFVIGEARDVFEYYDIRAELAKRPMPVGEDQFGTTLSEERFVIKLAKRTTQEHTIAELMAAMKKAGLM